MTDLDCYNAMRKKAKSLAEDAARRLDASHASDGKLAPHVVKEGVLKLRRIARQINALADFMEALP